MFRKFFDIERFTHSIKTMIACILGIILTHTIGFKADQWIVITIIVVMCAQLSVGSVIQKAYLRFLGTLIGCLFAAIALLTFGSSFTIITVTIALSGFIFSYLATSQENLVYASTLGAVTTAIIMLGQQPTVTFALQRFLEISAGILVATLVSHFVLPIHARTHLRRAQALTLEQLRDYYTGTLIERRIDKQSVDYHELDENIVKSLLKQRQLAKDSAREQIRNAFDSAHFMQTLHAEREILRAITFMHHALIHIKKHDEFLSQSGSMQSFNKAILNALDKLMKVIEPGNRSNLETIYIPNLDAVKADLETNADTPSRENWLYIDGFLFSAEVLLTSLTTLATLHRVPICPAPLP